MCSAAYKSKIHCISCLKIFPRKMQQCAHINIHFNHYSYSEQILRHFCHFELFATPHVVVWSDFQVFDISSQTWSMTTALKPKTTELENWSFIFFLFPFFCFWRGPVNHVLYTSGRGFTASPHSGRRAWWENMMWFYFSGSERQTLRWRHKGQRK